MSRSYKHTPRSGNKKDKFFKQYANRTVRYQLPTDKHSLKGAAYKKVFCQCNICDYETVGISFKQYWKCLVKSWYAWKRDCGYPYPDHEKAYQEYCKWFLRK